MTCKEKIDEIEKILDDEYETKIERIREVVDDEEDKAIPLEKVRHARTYILGLGTHGFINVYTALEILDKLIESEDK